MAEEKKIRVVMYCRVGNKQQAGQNLMPGDLPGQLQEIGMLALWKEYVRGRSGMLSEDESGILLPDYTPGSWI